MLEKITNLLRTYKGDDSLKVTEKTTFEEVGLDSLDMVEMIMEIEEEFGLSIEMDASIKDVATLIKIIEEAKR